MPDLQQLRADHASAVLAFERENRAFFAASVSDRGDAFFDGFDARFEESVAEQQDGRCAFFVLVDDDGSVIGRFNLREIGGGSADLGYRVAERAGGRGLATATVRQLCHLAAERFALRTLRAAVSTTNVASQRVLAKAGFVEVGPAEPEQLGGKPGAVYRCDLER